MGGARACLALAVLNLACNESKDKGMRGRGPWRECLGSARHSISRPLHSEGQERMALQRFRRDSLDTTQLMSVSKRLHASQRLWLGTWTTGHAVRDCILHTNVARPGSAPGLCGKRCPCCHSRCRTPSITNRCHWNGAKHLFACAQGLVDRMQ